MFTTRNGFNAEVHINLEAFRKHEREYDYKVYGYEAYSQKNSMPCEGKIVASSIDEAKFIIGDSF